MVTTELLVGAVLLIASAVAFWLALPRGGQVRSFLRNDQAQAYYAVGVLVGSVLGLVNVVVGLIGMIE